MTTVEPERRPITVEDYQHPEWCDISRCEPQSDFEDNAYGLHYSTGTTWDVQSSEVDVSVALVLGDDFLDGKQQSITRLRLSMQNWAWHSGSGMVDAEIVAEDARMLAAILTRHAERADRANRGNQFTGTAKEARHRP